MVYTIKLDMDIDAYEIINNDDMESILKEKLESAAVTVTDVKILDIND